MLALLKWFKLVCGPYTQFLPRQARKEPKLKSSYLRAYYPNLYTVDCQFSYNLQTAYCPNIYTVPVLQRKIFRVGEANQPYLGSSSFGTEMRDHRRSELEVFEAKPSIDLFRQWKTVLEFNNAKISLFIAFPLHW